MGSGTGLVGASTVMHLPGRFVSCVQCLGFSILYLVLDRYLLVFCNLHPVPCIYYFIKFLNQLILELNFCDIKLCWRAFGTKQPQEYKIPGHKSMALQVFVRNTSTLVHKYVRSCHS